MSSAINTAIYKRLTGIEVLTGRWLVAQQFLAATLGAYARSMPTPGLPNVFKGNVNKAPIVKDADGVLKPVITFRPSGGLPDHRFAHGLAVDDGLYDFEYWNWYSTANGVTDIAEAVELLLDRRFDGPPMVLSSGDCAWFDPMVSLTEFYDQERNGWFGLVRFQAVELRQ